MRSIRHKTLYLAAFVFAAGFAGSASAQRTCDMCMDGFRYCIADQILDRSQCVDQYNACASPMNCPLMPIE